MKMMLFEPAAVAGLELKNRLVLPPMATNSAGEGGLVSNETEEHYRRYAEAGNGLVVTEHCYVDAGGRFHPKQLSADGRDALDGLSRLAMAIKVGGAVPAMQINHAGSRVTAGALTGTAVSASDVPVPEAGVPCRPLSEPELEGLIIRFALAAALGKKAGFPVIEIHGAHGFLLGQFLSPFTNRRDDRYGGDLEGRARFPLAVVAAVREELGEGFPLSYRLGANDGVPGGLTLDEAVRFAVMLKESGVDIISVSGGLVGSRPEGMDCAGYFMPEAKAVRQATGLPVIGVGGITRAVDAELFLRDGSADLVAVGRSQLKDADWARKARQEGDA